MEEDNARKFFEILMKIAKAAISLEEMLGIYGFDIDFSEFDISEKDADTHFEKVCEHLQTIRDLDIERATLLIKDSLHLKFVDK
jgi:hypothetical protein